jgi:hypothetical protein
MADLDWTQIRIPLLMAQTIDCFLETKAAKKNGITSRSDFVIRLVSGWFSQYEKEFDIFVPRSVVRNTDDKDLPKPFD